MWVHTNEDKTQLEMNMIVSSTNSCRNAIVSVFVVVVVGWLVGWLVGCYSVVGWRISSLVSE
jgi:hypothetical protein